MGYKTRISPFGYPDLVISTFCGDNKVEIQAARGAEQTLRAVLESSHHLIFHHCAFDIPVFLKAFPHLSSLIVRAVDQGRIHDTKIMEVLLQIARGSRALNQKQLLLYPTLEKLALKRAGMVLNKDDSIRLGFGDYLGREELLPASFLDYATSDAIATYRVFASQWAEGTLYSASEYASGPLLPNALERFGLLSETIQVKAALAFAWLEQFPLRVDLPQLGRVKGQIGRAHV